VLLLFIIVTLTLTSPDPVSGLHSLDVAGSSL
jgi:hypothetical protein